MKRLILGTVGLCAAFAVTANLALAETHQQPAHKHAGKENAKTTETKKAHKGKLVKASEVVGAKIFNTQGQHIGEITDVVFDQNVGGVTHGILAIGGWLGFGENLAAIPWKHIHQSKSASPGYVLEVDKAKIAREDTFPRNQLPKFNERWYSDNYKRFGITTQKNVKLVRASEVMGANLFNRSGNEIGKITNLLMDPNTGNVAYGVLDVGDYVRNEGLTTVPWQLIHQSEKATPGYVLNIEKSKLEKAKFFTRNEWPNYNDTAWNDTTFSYYGVDPYWNNPYWDATF